MKTLCFATNNKNKLYEIATILKEQFHVKCLEDIGCMEELPETQDTLEGNSKQKSRYVFDNYSVTCFADDTGLEVETLNGAPGVYSARFAGAHRNNEDNIDLLLKKLSGELNRRAHFRTVITLSSEKEDVQFEGVVKGMIIEERRGLQGFGYDSIFVPEGQTKTFAEMKSEEKNAISHRGRAIKKLVDFLMSSKVHSNS